MTIQQLTDFGSTMAAPFQSGLEETFAKYEINTPLREAMFLAQCAHESGGFKRTSENLNYSAEALHGVFPKYFPTLQQALPFARQPEKIANRIYANRMGNGDTASGDGWKFRGRGLIQLTGKENVREFSMAYYNDERLVNDPSPLQVNPLAVVSAGWFWNSRQLNPLADASDIEAVTRKINGGLLGLDDRKRWYEKAKKILSIT